jgi:hypothetical protein
MPQQRKSPARSMYPNLPSSADNLASRNVARGSIGSGAGAIWNRLVSATRKQPEPQRPYWVPRTAPPPPVKRRK